MNKETLFQYFIFIIGGGIGILINWTITVFLVEMGVDFWISYTSGTIVNILFNFGWHLIITFGIPIKIPIAFTKFSILSLVLWTFNILLATGLVYILNLNYQVSAFAASFILSIGNYLVSSTYIFSSTIDPHLTDLEKIYGKVPNDFYDQQQATMNPLRSWFHRRRQELINLEVNKRLKEISNPTIVDLGCGNCAWNIQKLPVIGVDLSPHLLQYALENNRISKKIIAPTDNTNLPDNTADLVIISEVIEHLPDPNPTLQEIERILKSNGFLLVTVPFDTNLSFWKPLFTLQCFLQGNILRSIYYLNKCGHVKAYSPHTIQELLEKRFKVIEQFSMRRFTIFSICRKQPV